MPILDCKLALSSQRVRIFSRNPGAAFEAMGVGQTNFQNKLKGRSVRLLKIGLFIQIFQILMGLKFKV